MDLSALLERYQTLLPWSLARTKCFVNMILGMIASGSVQQHKTALGFVGIANQKSVCARIRGFLKTFDFNFPDYAAAILAMAQLKGPLTLALDRTNWKFGRIDINLLVLAVVVSGQFSIPILWQALPKKGNSNTQERIDLLQIFIIFALSLPSQVSAMEEVINVVEEQKTSARIMPTRGPDVPGDCIGQNLEYYQSRTPAPFFLVVRKPENIEHVAYWRPYNAWILEENDPKFNNPSPIIYHYWGYDREDNKLEIMLSYRVSEVDYVGFAEAHDFAGEGDINNDYRKPNKYGRSCVVKVPTDLKNTFGNNAQIVHCLN